MALSQAAAPRGVWLAAGGRCAQGRPSVTNWMPPALLCADWAQQLNTRLGEVRMSHPFFSEVGQAPFLSMFLYNIHQQRHGDTPVINEAVWPGCHMSSTLPQVQQLWPLGIMSSLLFIPIYMHPPNAIGVCLRKKEESLSSEGFPSYIFKYFPAFLGSSRVDISH